MKSCICPLGLHYEIRKCAYLSPRGIASKFKNAIKEFLPNFINSLKAFGEFLGSVSQFCPISDLEVFSPLDFYSFCLFFHCLGPACPSLAQLALTFPNLPIITQTFQNHPNLAWLRLAMLGSFWLW